MSSNEVRTDVEQNLHDQTVRKIALSRFDVEDWQVSANYGPNTNGKYVADIIACNTGKLVALGEIETQSTITDTEAAEWKEFGDSCSRFYLFVPEGTEDQAMNLIEKHQVVCAGLRCYSIDGDDVNVKGIAFQNGHSSCKDHQWWSDLGKTQG
jgi:hypothetical protein